MPALLLFAHKNRPSAPLAEQLAALMEERQLEAVAGRSAAEDDRFVAAMFIPGQLLVVSARYSAPGTAQLKITNREFREVYMDLNAASIAGTTILITDTQANGLQADDDTADMLDRGDGILRFDDDPGEQDLSRDEYRTAFVEADEQYARMLEVLIASARGDTGGCCVDTGIGLRLAGRRTVPRDDGTPAQCQRQQRHAR